MSLEDEARRWKRQKKESETADRMPSHNRTNGRTMDCRGCKFWSEKFARQIGRGPLRAMCLNRNSKNAYLYTAGRDYCDDWADGEDGAIDA